jgi:hypothetical protein
MRSCDRVTTAEIFANHSKWPSSTARKAIRAPVE